MPRPPKEPRRAQDTRAAPDRLGEEPISAAAKTSDVFISFVHEDEQVARAVQQLLERELKLPGRVFLSADQGQIYAGEFWLEKVRAALKAARVVVLMLSRRAVARPWVNFEAGAAWLKGEPIIPCSYGTLSVEELSHPYSGMAAINLEQEPYYLLTSIHHHLGLKSPEPRNPFLLQMDIEGRPKRRSTRRTHLDADELTLRSYEWLQIQLNVFRDTPRQSDRNAPRRRR